MSQILEEVRKISAGAIAKKQDSAKTKYPEILEQIKKAAGLGKTRCEFQEWQVDEYVQKLLKADGFNAWTTTKIPEDVIGYIAYDTKPKTIWVVTW